MKRSMVMLNLVAVLGFCLCISPQAFAWDCSGLENGTSDSDTASDWGAYATESRSPSSCTAYAKVWDAGVLWESGWATADSDTSYQKRYVTGTPSPASCDTVHYHIQGRVYAKVNGDAADGAPGNGSATAYGYAKVIGNASDGYNDNLKADLSATANESGGWSISITVGKDGVGAGFSVSGGGAVFSNTQTDDLDKEANMAAINAFAKLTLRARAEAAGYSGADGPQEGRGTASQVALTLTKN